MRYKNQVVFFILILAESLLLTVWRGKTGVYLSPLLIFFISLSVGMFPLFFRSEKFSPTKEKSSILLIINIISLISLTILILFLFAAIFRKNPVNPALSDIIPTVDILSHRLLAGEDPYQLITEYGYHIPPTYLPFQWLPFVISSFFGFGHRWIPVVFWLISLLFYEIYVFYSIKSELPRFLASLLPLLILLIFVLDFPQMFAVSIELIPAAYYILFGLSLLSSNIFLKSFAVTLPLLSRFSFVVWLPVWFVSLLKTEKIRKLLLFAGIAMMVILSVYILPFLSKRPATLIDGMKYYTISALGEWMPKDYQKAGEKPVHLFRGVGFACYFYDFYPGSIRNRLSALKKTQLSLVILTSLILIFFVLRKKKPDCLSLYLLSSLKIYLTVFYAFIQVPYVYLQLVPVFISAILFSGYLTIHGSNTKIISDA